MGYESALHVLGVWVAPERRPAVESLLARRSKGKTAIAFLLRQLAFSSQGTLELRPDDAPTDELPDDEGFVCSIWGKFSRAEQLACWLCRHCDEGQVILHSREGDGAAWGWEFKAGRIRYLELKPAEPWVRLRP